MPCSVHSMHNTILYRLLFLPFLGGNTLEAMAKAVENCAIIMPVLTEKYYASAACRQGRCW